MKKWTPAKHPRRRDGKFRDNGAARSSMSPKGQRCVTKVAERLELEGESPKRALERAFAICAAAGMHKTRGRVFVALKTYERELEQARRARS